MSQQRSIVKAGANEAAWLAQTDPLRMLKVFRTRPPQRKCALLCCAYLLSAPGGFCRLFARHAVSVLQQSAAVAAGANLPVTLHNAIVKAFPKDSTLARGLVYSTQRQTQLGSERFPLEGFVNALTSGAGATRQLVNSIATECLNRVRREARAHAPQQLAKLEAEHARSEVPTLSTPPTTPAPRAGWRGVLDRLFPPFQPLPVLPKPRKWVLPSFREAVLALLPEAERKLFAAVAWPDGRVPDALARRFATLAAETAVATTGAVMADLVREVLGNPFRPPRVDLHWLECNHGAARYIAQNVAETGGFAQLPILADALEDAGCCDQELLGHMRSGTAHVPGCWALDAVLGK